MGRTITVSREFGRRLAEQPNIACYDQEIISENSKRTKLADQC